MFVRPNFGSYIVFAFSLVLLLGSARTAISQSRQQIASECLDLLADRKMEQSAIIAEQIMLWKNLFSPNIIKDGEACLNRSTGEYWKYFTTKGRFLVGDEARAEQAFIDGADERRAEKERELQKRQCRVSLLEIKVAKLETQMQRVREERRLESRLETWAICADRYASNKEATLLEPVCNALFATGGLPDSSNAFDYLELQVAQLSLLNAQASLTELLAPNSAPDTTEESLVAKCKAILQ